MSDLKELQTKIGYTFKNENILLNAITHSSFANEQKDNQPFNERLEFLGDSVLSIVVSDYLFELNKNSPEGDLTKTRAALVCEGSCHEFAKKIELGTFLRLGKGEELSGGRTRASILADAFEAVIAAIYLDGGIETASKFILEFVKNEQVSAEDYKTKLQEIIQKNPEERLRYSVVDEQGPDHNKVFTVNVKINSNVIGTGTGYSKKTAEQLAAKQALTLFGENN